MNPPLFSIPSQPYQFMTESLFLINHKMSQRKAKKKKRLKRFNPKKKKKKKLLKKTEEKIKNPQIAIIWSSSHICRSSITFNPLNRGLDPSELPLYSKNGPNVPSFSIFLFFSILPLITFSNGSQPRYSNRPQIQTRLGFVLSTF